jgi:hypothetical protein
VGFSCRAWETPTDIRHFISDKPVKSRHSHAGGNPYAYNQFKILDSRFQGNDEIEASATFCQIARLSDALFLLCF